MNKGTVTKLLDLIKATIPTRPLQDAYVIIPNNYQNTTALFHNGTVIRSHPVPAQLVRSGVVLYGYCQEIESKLKVIASGNIPDHGSLMGNDMMMVDVEIEVPHSVLASLIKDIGANWDIDYLLEMGLVID
ncbi:desiccation protectant Lea14 homolog [Olea europaea subsp. europaea]|uniref:Desiccation protectant Lea14 homolog n=1 Tax=Olea europaea subsp. europaea TaxID=158383 RepID=A0A8S0SAT9_OLEEU|nr:desiccation protectant Lea14 homolog [Olea europaea subsp. europaea]